MGRQGIVYYRTRVKMRQHYIDVVEFWIIGTSPIITQWGGCVFPANAGIQSDEFLIRFNYISLPVQGHREHVCRGNSHGSRVNSSPISHLL
jgi:hypothetical protein